MATVDEHFRCMGCDVRVLLDDDDADDRALRAEAARVRELLHGADDALSRFRPGSELSRANASPLVVVPAGPLLRAFARAGRWAGERSGGLVDVTLHDAIVAQGYGRSLDGVSPAPLSDALAAAPARRRASPDPAARWRRLHVDPEGMLHRPAGVRLDPGAVAKGLAADLATAVLDPATRYVISCGGDLLVGGPRARATDVVVEDARGGGVAHRLTLRAGGVATSGISRRIWRDGDGGFAHHVLDPSTGEPAWTGLVSATAIGETALEAEVLASVALLSGPRDGRWALRRRGGVLQHDDGRIEVVDPAPRVTLPRPAALRPHPSTAASRGFGRSERPTFATGAPSTRTMSAV